ncbi:hypothetical protein [Streptomyces sp. NPDC004658]|uniref:hypothetical protein n=1 Tax=Streptomyces sp. NPDC004658 TaxID=3154672 RepID=UPI00339E0486
MKRTWNKNVHTAGLLLAGGAAVLAVVQGGAGLGHQHRGIVPAPAAVLAGNQDWGVVVGGTGRTVVAADPAGTSVTPANQDWGITPADTGLAVPAGNQDWG